VDIAPHLLETIPKKLINKRTVQEAIRDNLWINDISGSLSVGALADFLCLWDMVAQVDLCLDKEDKHIFRLAANGKYSAKAAYERLFLGSVEFEPYERIGKLGLRLNVGSFYGWLLIRSVGRQIDLKSGVWIIRKDVLFVTRKGRQLIICLWLL
jgi:hypothetical protein